ncbi:hypothetical protein, partial [Photobacterium sp. 1_MG-2023]|uniref:hypothetical protein n=1 Tax=Photobacterium sp. 1_MG-2023 TaxID=3062646 RepID=UPI0026E1F1A0
IVHFCALSFVTDDAEMFFDGIDIHGHSSKEEHKITIGSSGQFSPSIEQKTFMILPCSRSP